MLWDGKMSKTSKIPSTWQARGSWELFTKLRQIPIIENLAAARFSIFTESLWFGKYGKSVRGSICWLLPPHSRASIPLAHSQWVATHKHDHENTLHVQRTSSRHALPSRHHHLCRPGIERFRGAALPPSSPSFPNPSSIPACSMLARSFPPSCHHRLTSISIHKWSAIVFPREKILSGFPQHTQKR